MAKGGARIGAGRPKKPLAAHWVTDTYRRDRHGALPKHVHALQPQGVQGADIPTDGLGDAGRELVARLSAAYEFSPAESVIVVEAAHAADALAALRSLPLGGKTAGEVNAVMRLEQCWSRLLTSLLFQLKVTTNEGPTT